MGNFGKWHLVHQLKGSTAWSFTTPGGIRSRVPRPTNLPNRRNSSLRDGDLLHRPPWPRLQDRPCSWRDEGASQRQLPRGVDWRAWRLPEKLHLLRHGRLDGARLARDLLRPEHRNHVLRLGVPCKADARHLARPCARRGRLPVLAPVSGRGLRVAVSASLSRMVCCGRHD